MFGDEKRCDDLVLSSIPQFWSILFYLMIIMLILAWVIGSSCYPPANAVQGYAVNVSLIGLVFACPAMILLARQRPGYYIVKVSDKTISIKRGFLWHIIQKEDILALYYNKNLGFNQTVEYMMLVHGTHASKTIFLPAYFSISKKEMVEAINAKLGRSADAHQT